MLTVRSSILICLSAAGLACGVLLKQETVALTGLAILLLIWLQWLSFATMRRSTRKFRQSIERLIDKQTDATITMVTDRTYEVELRFDLSKLRPGYRITIQDAVPDGFSVSGLSQIVFESPTHGFWPSVGSSQTDDSSHRYDASSQSKTQPRGRRVARLKYIIAVSYTHLTLPTILRV